MRHLWEVSSVGSVASALQAEGHRFESSTSHELEIGQYFFTITPRERIISEKSDLYFAQVGGTKFIFNPLGENNLPRSQRRWATEPGAPSVGRQGFSYKSSALWQQRADGPLHKSP